MFHFPKPAGPRRFAAAAAGVAATAVLITAALVGVAFARAFTLKVAKSAKVTNQSGVSKRQNIAVTSRGFAVYTLSGDSKSHPKCTKRNGCFTFWPPVTVSSAKKLGKTAGIKGKLGVWRRRGFLQVTLSGHPLYRYAADTHARSATGEGLRSFGGTWHVVKAAGSAGGSGTTSTPTTTTTTTPSCAYPPCY